MAQWYWAVFTQALRWCVVNTYILQRECLLGRKEEDTIAARIVKRLIVEGLCSITSKALFLDRPRRPGNAALSATLDAIPVCHRRFEQAMHLVGYHAALQRCQGGSKDTRHRTYLTCLTCRVPLCPEHFFLFHTANRGTRNEDHYCSHQEGAEQNARELQEAVRP